MPAARDDAFRKLIEGAPDGVVISRDGIVLYANPQAVAILGYGDPAELVGQPMSVFLDVQALATMRRRIQRMRETGERLPPREYDAVRRDGARVTAEISSIFIEHDGQPALLAFVRDVTERTRLRAQMAQVDRLAALGRMAVGIAHDVNNPLSFVSLSAEALAERLEAAAGSADLLELVRDVQLGADRIAAIVRDLRTYGRYEDEAAHAVDLGEILASAERLVTHQLAPRVRVERDRGDLPPVLGVATRLEQVFVNLMLNAGHAIPAARDDGRVLVRATAHGEEVVVEVEDDGDGIPPELLDRIFEPFFTTRAAGTGLGLSICRDLLARCEGTISARSEPGRGTTMRVTLRRASAEEPAARVSVEHPRAPVAHRRILVIDDEPLIVKGLARMCEPDHAVVGATSGEDGLARILADPGFDVVLCDVMMPGMTGMELHDRVTRERPGLEQRFVFMTGGAPSETVRGFLDGVPNAKLFKPFSMAELEAALEGIARA